MNFDQLIRFAAEPVASVIHLPTTPAPLLRINGLIRSVESPPVTAEMLFQFINSLRPNLPVEAIKEAMVAGLDFSHAIPGVSRYRCNVYSHLGTPAMVLRVIKLKIR